MKIPEVRAWPCGAGDEDFRLGPVIANNANGLAGYQQPRVAPKDVRWEGIMWRLASDENGGVLWVLCPSRETVEAHRPKLTRLAQVIAEYGGIAEVIAELGRGHTDTLAPRTIPVGRPMPKPSSKRLALNAITLAVSDAVAEGVSMAEIRLAVFSAMGLDSDAS